MGFNLRLKFLQNEVLGYKNLTSEDYKKAYFLGKTITEIFSLMSFVNA